MQAIYIILALISFSFIIYKETKGLGTNIGSKDSSYSDADVNDSSDYSNNSDSGCDGQDGGDCD